MEKEEIELRKLELERSHQCSIEFGRGSKNVMTWKAKMYWSLGMEGSVLGRAKGLKKELDALCEVVIDG